MIGTDGEKESGKSVLSAQLDGNGDKLKPSARVRSEISR